MDRKRRHAIYIEAAILMIVGFVCIIIAASNEGNIDDNYVNIIGFSSFVFWGLALVVLIKNYSKLVSSEMDEIAKKMYKEETFFSSLYIKENAHILSEKFKKAGFIFQKKCLYKRQFSFWKDYVNYYAIIIEEANIEKHFAEFLENYEDFLLDNHRFNKNNVFYVVYFNNTVTDQELELLKNCIINQDVLQGLPIILDTFLPIVYDTYQEKYMIRTIKSRFSIKLLQIALRKFYKVILSSVK